jgi:hypothetical protein
MSERNAALNSLIDKLISRPTHVAESVQSQSSDSGDQAESSLAVAAEYWGRRIVWTLVILMSLWDIAVTFDRPSVLAARLF